MNRLLKKEIMTVMHEWSNDIQFEFDMSWHGYSGLQDELWERFGYKVEMKDLKDVMKKLSSENLVELKSTYDDDYHPCGSGWFLAKNEKNNKNWDFENEERKT